MATLLVQSVKLQPAEARCWKRIQARCGRPKVGPAGIDLEELIDVTQFPEIELKLWEVHVRAIRDYVPKPYAGRVTLFRTRTQPVPMHLGGQLTDIDYRDPIERL